MKIINLIVFVSIIVSNVKSLYACTVTHLNWHYEYLENHDILLEVNVTVNEANHSYVAHRTKNLYSDTSKRHTEHNHALNSFTEDNLRGGFYWDGENHFNAFIETEDHFWVSISKNKSHPEPNCVVEGFSNHTEHGRYLIDEEAELAFCYDIPRTNYGITFFVEPYTASNFESFQNLVESQVNAVSLVYNRFMNVGLYIRNYKRDAAYSVLRANKDVSLDRLKDILTSLSTDERNDIGIAHAIVNGVSGGLAYLGSLCAPFGGVSRYQSSYGFHGTLAHEIGHQFGLQHPFSGTSDQGRYGGIMDYKRSYRLLNGTIGFTYNSRMTLCKNFNHFYTYLYEGTSYTNECLNNIVQIEMKDELCGNKEISDDEECECNGIGVTYCEDEDSGAICDQCKLSIDVECSSNMILKPKLYPLWHGRNGLKANPDCCIQGILQPSDTTCVNNDYPSRYANTGTCLNGECISTCNIVRSGNYTTCNGAIYNNGCKVRCGYEDLYPCSSEKANWVLNNTNTPQNVFCLTDDYSNGACDGLGNCVEKDMGLAPRLAPTPRPTSLGDLIEEQFTTSIIIYLSLAGFGSIMLCCLFLYCKCYGCHIPRCSRCRCRICGKRDETVSPYSTEEEEEDENYSGI